MDEKIREIIKKEVYSDTYTPKTPKSFFKSLGEGIDKKELFDTFANMLEKCEVCLTQSGKVTTPESIGLITGIYSFQIYGKGQRGGGSIRNKARKRKRNRYF